MSASEPTVRGERGDSSISLVLIVPVIVFLLGIFIFVGRTSMAENTVVSAANAAARDASLARDAATARTAGREAALRVLDQAGTRCSSLEVTINAAGLHAALGQTATVSATVHCTADLSRIGLPGIPGSKQLRATGMSPVDQYRER